MLKLKGDKGKSTVAEALHKYNFAPVYVYDKEPIETVVSDFIPSEEVSIDEFCKALYDHIRKHNMELLPIETIVIYTNIPESKCGLIFDYAELIEKENLVKSVIVTCR